MLFKNNLFVHFVISFIFLLLSSCFEEAIPDRIKFIGSYACFELCSSGTDNYQIIISESGAAENAIFIYNLYDWDETASATVNGNSISIPPQRLDGLIFSGSGTISANTLTINLNVVDAFDSDNCLLNCTKR
jgi:hypothetical protein